MRSKAPTPLTRRQIETACARIQAASSYYDRYRCLTHLRCELVRLGLRENDLAPYQRQVLSELEDGPSEASISQMHWWWHYNRDKLIQRGRGGHNRPAKPRIDLEMFFTSKGNFVIEWKPTGVVRGHLGPDCDWECWYFTPGVASYRPSNELVFVRSLEDVSRQFEIGNETAADLRRKVENWPEKLKSPNLHLSLKIHRLEYKRLRMAIDATLLQAAAELVTELRDRLGHSFEVRMVSDIVTEWREVKDKTKVLGKDRRLAKWTIENVAERTERLEREELARFPKQYKCSVEDFMQAFSDADKRKKTGPPPMPHSKDNRIVTALKKAGHSSMSLSVVRRYLELLQRYRPELFPVQPPANVVPLKRPN